ncbi:TIGR02269 family lipoprotein [Corallococcus sp. AB049A]|nr:TIGR02269 family lipoprotein [Corallococcus sp. AB049A]
MAPAPGDGGQQPAQHEIRAQVDEQQDQQPSHGVRALGVVRSPQDNGPPDRAPCPGTGLLASWASRNLTCNSRKMRRTSGGGLRVVWLWLVLLLGCASAPVRTECEASHEDQCLTQVCEDDVCALFRCEDLAPKRIVRTRGAMPVAPIFVAPGSGPQRTWGSAQGLPGDAVPVMVFRWHRREKLPSELRREKALQEWAKRPKERHHIFPQAFKKHFEDKGIEIHKYVLMIDAEVHARIHRGALGGPWNRDWNTFIELQGVEADIPDHFAHAAWMIRKYELFGLPMTYWQQVDLLPVPFED